MFVLNIKVVPTILTEELCFIVFIVLSIILIVEDNLFVNIVDNFDSEIPGNVSSAVLSCKIVFIFVVNMSVFVDKILVDVVNVVDILIECIFVVSKCDEDNIDFDVVGKLDTVTSEVWLLDEESVVVFNFEKVVKLVGICVKLNSDEDISDVKKGNEEWFFPVGDCDEKISVVGNFNENLFVISICVEDFFDDGSCDWDEFVAFNWDENVL